MTGQPQGLNCPLCSQPPALVIGTQQAMCGNEECKALFWDPTKTIDELMDTVHIINLTGWRQ